VAASLLLSPGYRKSDVYEKVFFSGRLINKRSSPMPIQIFLCRGRKRYVCVPATYNTAGCPPTLNWQLVKGTSEAAASMGCFGSTAREIADVTTATFLTVLSGFVFGVWAEEKRRKEKWASGSQTRFEAKMISMNPLGVESG
jgi:hypothetical protein